MALGDSEHPISFRFEPRIEGAHVKVTVRSGIAGSRAFAGELVFQPEEWAVFVAHVIALGAPVEVGPITAAADRPDEVVPVQIHIDEQVGTAAQHAAYRLGFDDGFVVGRRVPR